jgi:hypothetical protein
LWATNLKTANMLGHRTPLHPQQLADEVIEFPLTKLLVHAVGEFNDQ